MVRTRAILGVTRSIIKPTGVLPGTVLPIPLVITVVGCFLERSAPVVVGHGVVVIVTVLGRVTLNDSYLPYINPLERECSHYLSKGFSQIVEFDIALDVFKAVGEVE